MIELVFLASLVLLGLHFLTNRPAKAAPRKPPAPKPEPEPECGYDFEISYTGDGGSAASHKIAGVRAETVGGQTLIHARCSVAGAEVAFDNSRIASCRNLRSGRAIKDLARYCQTRKR